MPPHPLRLSEIVVDPLELRHPCLSQRTESSSSGRTQQVPYGHLMAQRGYRGSEKKYKKFFQKIRSPENASATSPHLESLGRWVPPVGVGIRKRLCLAELNRYYIERVCISGGIGGCRISRKPLRLGC